MRQKNPQNLKEALQVMGSDGEGAENEEIKSGSDRDGKKYI